MPLLRLFATPTCPYSAKVRNKLNDMGIEFTELDTNDKEHEETLLQLGGKRQVPFLVDDEKGKQMYESDDIIKYLELIWRYFNFITHINIIFGSR